MSGDGVDARDGQERDRSLPERIGPAAVSVLQGDTHGVLLVAGEGRDVLFSNARAAQALGFDDAGSLIREGLPPSAPGTARLKALLAEPPSIHPTLERLRFFVGFRGVMRVAFCRVVAQNDGSPAIVVAFTEDMAGEGKGLPPSIGIEITGNKTTPFESPERAVSAQQQPAEPVALSWIERPAAERQPCRFLFALDEEGQIRSVTPPLAETVGAGAAAIEGRKLPDVLAAFDAEAGATVATAIEAGETFAHVRVLWPVEGHPLAVPVTLAALPLIEQDTGLKGFSGFGQCRPDLAEAFEAGMGPDQAMNDNAEPDAAPGHDLADDDSSAAPADDLAPDAPETSGDQPSLSLDETPAALPESLVDPDDERRAASREEAGAAGDDSKVISLRTGQPTQPLPGFQRQGLSMSERNAFREIAKALGARFDEGDATDENEPDEALSEPAPWPVPVRPENPNQPAAPAPVSAMGTGLLDRLPIGLLVLKGDEALFANQTLLDLTDYRDFQHFVAEDGPKAIFRKGVRPRADFPALDTIVLATREGEMIPVDSHLQLIDWDGEQATLISFRRAVELEQGKALRSVALDLKRARSDAEELRAILNTATDGVVTLDERGTILALNGAAQALFGVSENEIVGESITQLLYRDSHAEALDYLEGMRAPGLRSILNDGREVSGREKKGGRIPLFMTLGRISEEEPRRFCAVLRDMTAWKRAEAGLTEARQAAEMANAKKSDFLAKISHEIRTPMNAIIGFADLMQEERLGPVGNEKYKEYLGDIRTSGEHVVSLVNDLLDLAKIEAGRMELNFAATDLNAIVGSTVAIIQPQATQSRVLVRTQLAQALPPVVADERSIRQIVLNMLSNATRFTEAGGQVIVSTSMLQSGEVAIRIRDTGIGMTTSEIEQALEPFRQVGRDRSKGGTGLGLPLTKALVEANRANFVISSRPGEGTLIEIIFPATRVLAE